jgi:hypothetical protein
MESGLIELTKRKWFRFAMIHTELKKITHHQYKKNPWPDLPIPRLAADFFKVIKI